MSNFNYLNEEEEYSVLMNASDMGDKVLKVCHLSIQWSLIKQMLHSVTLKILSFHRSRRPLLFRTKHKYCLFFRRLFQSTKLTSLAAAAMEVASIDQCRDVDDAN